jgi:hypothetical protein
MNSEIELLQLIWKNGQKSSVRLLASKANFGMDYTRYILGGLHKKRLIATLKKRDYFAVSSRGKKILFKMGYQDAEAKRVRKKPPRRKATTPRNRKVVVAAAVFPKGTNEMKGEEIKVRPEESQPQVILVHNLASSDGERKLNIGKVIEKTAASLKGFLHITNI